MRISDEIKEHLRFLEVEGRLTPERVVEDAKRLESPLHPYFDWNVETAAVRHWLDHARAIIRSVKVVVTFEEIRLRAPLYVSDPTKDRARDQGYRSVEVIRSDPRLAKQTLMLECQRAASVLQRARLIAITLDLTDQLDTVLATIAGLRAAIETPPPTM